MSKPPLDDLALRKLMLQQRCAVQREVLAVQVRQTFAPAVRTVAQVKAGGQWVKQHPWLVALAGGLLLAWRPRAAVGLLGRGWGLWQTWRRLRPTVQRMLELARQAQPPQA